jgi:hypothetical protein
MEELPRTIRRRRANFVFLTRTPSWPYQSLQRTQVIRHVAEFSDHRGVAKFARGRVTSAAECDGADVAFFARQRLGAHHNRNRIEEAFGRLAGSYAVMGGDKG